MIGFLQNRFGADDSAESEISLEDGLDVLSNSRRRHVIRLLAESDDGALTLRELSRHIAARENNKALEEVKSDDRKAIYVGLYQAHLPVLKEKGVVDFEGEPSGIITATPAVDTLAEVLKVAGDHLGGEFA